MNVKKTYHIGGDNMEIAKGIDNTEYKKLNLNIDDYNNTNWNIAFSYLEKRLFERFIDPAELLIKSEAV